MKLNTNTEAAETVQTTESPVVVHERFVVPLPRFSWKKCYGMHGREHWALCDTETDPRQVACLEMILWDHLSVDLDKAHMPKLIADLLNEHFRHNVERTQP
jgi:hypothetical protein